MNKENMSEPPRRGLGEAGCLVKGCGAILAVAVLVAALAYWAFAVGSHHESRSTIWVSEYRSMTPPDALGITLWPAWLDHRAEYTIREEELRAFLNEVFGLTGNSLSKGSPVGRDYFDRRYGARRDGTWTWHEGLVEYEQIAPNGGVHTFLHDPVTGLTYQESAHW